MLNAARSLLAAAAMAAVFGGCSQADDDDAADFKGEQKLVANVVDDLQDAGRDILAPPPAESRPAGEEKRSSPEGGPA